MFLPLVLSTLSTPISIHSATCTTGTPVTQWFVWKSSNDLGGGGRVTMSAKVSEYDVGFGYVRREGGEGQNVRCL